jgi:hypothetical protein
LGKLGFIVAQDKPQQDVGVDRLHLLFP